MPSPSRWFELRVWLGLIGGLAAMPLALAADEPQQLARGKALFTQTQPACAVCHTLAAAGSEGQVGPVLDELKPDAERVRKVLRAGLGAMPSFADKLSAADIEALAVFVARSTGGAVQPPR
ncbi:MAG: sulfide dehydrogenase [Burkholderiales bacterium PBB2]|nr:MAG: sulfide dehydrogenase [Burkholderiales bacterium PBB2]